MGLVYASIHEKIALGARDYFNLTGLIETGTYFGDTALWASDKFERVATIEISPNFYKIAEDKLEGTHNVLMVLGSSRDWLGQVCRGRDNKPTLFWLDAHWIGDMEVLDPLGNPLLDEIRIINDNFFGTHVIMIDDYSLLGDSSPIINLLENKLNQNRQVRIMDDIYFAAPRIPEMFETWKK